MNTTSKLVASLAPLKGSLIPWQNVITCRGRPAKVSGSDQTPVIANHPDVKRMLLSMKSTVEAMRMVSAFSGYCMDLHHCEQGDASREAKALLDFLIPICKAGNTDKAWFVTGEAVQVYGGYGYCADYPVEQLARDSKILAIYEGTNGIQSIDLTMRKLLLNPEYYNYQIYKKYITETLDKAKDVVDQRYIDSLHQGITAMDQTVTFLNRLHEKGEVQEILFRATTLQQAFRILSHGWMHLWALSLTQPALQNLSNGQDVDETLLQNNEIAFYFGKTASSKYFLDTEYKELFSLLNIITENRESYVDLSTDIFTGALDE